MNLKTLNLLDDHRQVLLQGINQNVLAALGTRLPFTMQAQTQTNWCWAATSNSVSHFYTLTSTWTQCKVANACLNKTTCCNTPGPCNVYGYLDLALTKTSNFNSMVSGTITFAKIQTEINAGRPIGARTAWSGGGAHFLCIIGYAVVSGVNYVYLDDPIYGPSFTTLSNFTTSYRGSGTWTHTYYTKKAPSIMKVKLPQLKANILDAIKTIRPIVFPENERAQFTAAGGASENPSVTLPHHVYVVGLSDVNKGKLSKDNSYLRVVEADSANVKALYDVDDTVGGAAQIRNIVSQGEQLNHLHDVFDIVAEETEKNQKEVEMHFVDIPALYVEAVWLNYDGKDKDVFIPTRSIGNFEAKKVYSNQEFMKLLKEAAAQIPDMKADDTLGG